jgi:hypothetical protein
MKRNAKVLYAELSFDALPVTETSDLLKRAEHEGPDGGRQVTFVYDDFDCPCNGNSRGAGFEVFEGYLRKEIEEKFTDEILRLGRLGSFPRLHFSLATGNATCSNTEVSREMIRMLARKDMSLGMTFAAESRGGEVKMEFPASLIKYLAKYQFAVAF